MTTGPTVDGVLVQWGERLFHPASRIVKPDATPRLNAPTRPSAAAIRQRIAATVARRAPPVMVKVTGGGRGNATGVSMCEATRRADLACEGGAGWANGPGCRASQIGRAIQAQSLPGNGGVGFHDPGAAGFGCPGGQGLGGADCAVRAQNTVLKEVKQRQQREAVQAGKQRPVPVQSHDIPKTRPSIDMER